jgi:hypothetical protein
MMLLSTAGYFSMASIAKENEFFSAALRMGNLILPSLWGFSYCRIMRNYSALLPRKLKGACSLCRFEKRFCPPLSCLGMMKEGEGESLMEIFFPCNTPHPHLPPQGGKGSETNVDQPLSWMPDRACPGLRSGVRHDEGEKSIRKLREWAFYSLLFLM